MVSGTGAAFVGFSISWLSCEWSFMVSGTCSEFVRSSGALKESEVSEEKLSEDTSETEVSFWEDDS